MICQNVGEKSKRQIANRLSTSILFFNEKKVYFSIDFLQDDEPTSLLQDAFQQDPRHDD